MQTVEISLLLLLIVAVGGALVRWTHMGLPIFLVVTGGVASFLPGLDRISVDPSLFLLLFIPPLLYADARSLFIRIPLQRKVVEIDESMEELP